MDQMEIVGRLERIETALSLLLQKQTVKEWYSTDQFAQIVERSEFTVREWCRHGRIKAQKRPSGRGAFCSWAICHEELLRYQREGLLQSRDT